MHFSQGFVKGTALSRFCDWSSRLNVWNAVHKLTSPFSTERTLRWTTKCCWWETVFFWLVFSCCTSVKISQGSLDANGDHFSVGNNRHCFEQFLSMLRTRFCCGLPAAICCFCLKHWSSLKRTQRACVITYCDRNATSLCCVVLCVPK